MCYLSPNPPFCKGGFIRVSDSRLYRLPSVCSRLLRTFDPLKDYSGRGQSLAKTKGEISHAKTRSKIGQQGVCIISILS